MSSNRSRFLTATAAAFASVAYVRWPASAAQYSLRYASAQQADNPVTLAMKSAAQKIRDESNGRIEISIFPNSILGGDTAMLSQLRTGAIAFLTYLDGNLSALVPISAISNVGYAFENYGDVFAAMDGPLGALVRAQIKARGLWVFDRIWDNGYRQMTTSTHPITAPGDLKGAKIRVPTSAIEVALFRALGASPTPINFSEVYSALQTHVVDGEENPLTIIENGKLNEVQKYLSLTSHVWTGFWFLANAAQWQALPKDMQDIVARNIDGAAVDQRKESERMNTSLLATLKSQGMQVNTPARAAFKEQLRSAGFYADWRSRFGPDAWALLEKTTGSLG